MNVWLHKACVPLLEIEFHTSPYPEDWIEAEKYYETAKYQFDSKDYVSAAKNYKHAFDAYADIIAKSNDK